jgi:dihydrofolate reductase
MKLTTVTNVSLDGVTQGHRRIDAGTEREAGVPDEERSGGFERLGWAPPLLDDEASLFISQAFQRADAFQFGRRTYEIFAGSWGAGMDPGNPVGEALNTRPKYVASTSLTDPQWANTTVLSGLPHHGSPAVRDGHDLKQCMSIDHVSAAVVVERPLISWVRCSRRARRWTAAQVR